MMDRRTGDALAAFQRGRLDEARELAKKQLATHKRSPPLLYLMGLIECRSGQFEKGVEWLRQAASEDPANAAFRLMLIRALIDCGRAAEALTVPLPTRAVDATSAAMWHARAEAAQVLEEWAIAADAWQRLSIAQPADWRAFSNWGEALAKSGRWSEAAAALSRAAELNPEEVRIRRNLASALGRSGKHEQCAFELEQLIAALPHDAGLRLTLARILADLGRNGDSMAHLRDAARLMIGTADAAQKDEGLVRIAIDPSSPPERISDADIEQVRELALLLDRTNRIDALRNLLAEAEVIGITRAQLGYPAAAMALREGDAMEAKRLLQSEAVETDPVRWHRLMARIEDALGNPDASFAEAAAMNLAVPDEAHWRDLGKAYRDELRSIARTIESLEAMPLTLEPGDRPSPAFLVGFPRSGTTLADTFLMGHPATAVLEELPMLQAAESALGGMAQLFHSDRRGLQEARNAYFAVLDRHGPGDRDRRLVIDKLPLNMTRLPLIKALFPDARIIFAKRHPCDAVLSAFMQSFVPNPAMASFLNISDAADLYDGAMTLFCESSERLRLEVHTIVYEELIEDPASTLERAIDYLALQWHPELLDHRRTAERRGAIDTPSYDQVSEPLNNRAVGRWRRYAGQLGPILPTLLPWARRLGYDDR